MSRDLKVFVLGASLREGSSNLRLAEEIGRRLRQRGVRADVASFHRFDAPSFDADVEAAEGLPAAAASFAQRLLDADAFVVVAPEYNHSVPGYLKNTIDWVSRHAEKPFHGHHALLASASPSMVGGDRGLSALRIPLEALGTHVFPTQFALARAHQAWDDDGALADPGIRALLDGMLDGFVATVGAVRAAEAERAEQDREAA